MAADSFFTPEERAHLPVHIAAIMDGNGRWAQQRGLPRTAGHKEGAETFRRISEFLADLGIRYFTVYALSAENLKRPPEEVGVIMGLLERYLLEAIETMAARGICLSFFGDLSVLPERFRRLAERTDAISAGISKPRITVNACVNYGGRQEIARAAGLAARAMARGEIEDITPETLGRYMYSAQIPDPDLIIRPGRELRLSNFLLWQSAYSEYYFTDVLWPDMNEEEMAKAIRSFMGRKRRFGGL